MEVTPGVRWLTMPMGGSLNHINLYLLEDRLGWWVVDTGLALPETETLWREIFANELAGKPVVGVICTHMHPDHIGQASMITDEFRCPLYMTRAEYYQARAFSSMSGPSHSSWLGQAFFQRSVPRSGFVKLGIECEIAVELARNIFPSDGPFTRENIAPAVQSVMVAMEIVDAHGW